MRRGLKQCLRCMRQLPVLQIFLGLCIGLWLTILDPAAPAAMRCFHVPVRKHRRTVRDSHGVVYVLGLHSPIIEVYRKRYNGRGPYLDELLGSLRTLRQNSPRTPVALVTDAEDNINASVAAMFDQVIVQEGKVHVSWGDVIPAVLASPWRRSLFLDLDVKVLLYFQICEDVEHMFGWLDNYEIGLVLEPFLFSHVKGALLRDGPQAITWNSLNNWNTGMLLYDNNPRVRAMFEDWNAAYNYPGGRGGGDQDEFMKALERSGVRVKQLPAEYNLRVHTNTLPHFLTNSVILLHSRYETCKRLNRVTGPRLYDHLKEDVVYTWRLPRAPAWHVTVSNHLDGPLVSECVADRVTKLDMELPKLKYRGEL